MGSHVMESCVALVESCQGLLMDHWDVDHGPGRWIMALVESC